jgi:hypothetical protein
VQIARLRAALATIRLSCSVSANANFGLLSKN